MSGIFISYRREDSAGHAGRIYDRLREHFGREMVFMDVSGIEPGVDFVEAIDRAVGSCDALLVIIGSKWLTCTDSAGRRRLDDPQDFIRLETATALKRGIRVVPVLVQKAAMPTESDLPEDLKKLARRQATEIDDTHWDSDTDQLIETLVKVVPGTPRPLPHEVREEAPTPPVGETAPTSSLPPLLRGKNKLTWIISTITAVVVALGGLLSTIESYRDTISSFFRTEKKIVQEAPVTPQPPLPANVTVPDLIGASRDEALVRLGQEHLRLGNVKTVPSDHRAGSVVEQDPAPGSQLPPESSVNLVVAEKKPKPPAPEPEVKTVAVPKLVGEPLAKARELLAKAGLKAGKAVRKETGDVPEGTVIEQAPAPRTKLARGKTVEMVVAVSPPEPEMITVPDVTEKEVKEAIALLKETGLSVESRRAESSSARPGTVLRQSLKPGSRVRSGETVSLIYAVAPRDTTVTATRRERLPAIEDTVTATRVARLPAPVQTSPEEGRVFDNYPRTTALRWEAVKGAASYVVELDCLHCCESGKWCSDLGKPWKVVRDIPLVRSPGYKFDFVGAQPGRWRVWAVDERGREGGKSPWRTFRYTK